VLIEVAAVVQEIDAALDFLTEPALQLNVGALQVGTQH
jgi:hypothetical protein